MALLSLVDAGQRAPRPAGRVPTIARAQAAAIMVPAASFSTGKASEGPASPPPDAPTILIGVDQIRVGRGKPILFI